MVDMHAHILPYVDHGSVSTDMSLGLLDAAQNVGVDTIVATPHFYLDRGHTVDKFLKKRQNGLDSFLEAMDKSNRKCNIISAAEVRINFGLSNIDLSRLCVGNTNLLLLQMPMTDVWNEWMYNEISAILSKHEVRILIAHIDRYKVSEVTKLFNCFDLYAQINASSARSFMTRRKIRRYLDMNIVCAIGSDVHRSDDSYKNFTRFRKHFGDDTVDMIDARSRSLISGGNNFC